MSCGLEIHNQNKDDDDEVSTGKELGMERDKVKKCAGPVVCGPTGDRYGNDCPDRRCYIAPDTFP